MKTYNILSSGTSATAGINPLLAMRRHTLALLMAAAAGTAFTACTGDELTASTDEAALDPNTPVGITATLGAYGTAASNFNSRSFASRSGELTNEDLAAMAAEGEFTASTNMNGTMSHIYFYNYVGADEVFQDKEVASDFYIKGTLNNMTFIGKDNAERTAPFYLKDFNVKEANKAAILILQENIDFVIAAADRTVDADGAPGYAFTLKHTGAKLSVRLQDKDGKVIASDALATNGMMIVYPQGAFSGTAFDKVTKASDYTYKVAKLGDYPNQQYIKPITEHEGYYNVVIQASVGTGTGEAEGTTPTAYTADHKLTVSLAADAEAGKPAGSYSLPLSSVKLTGLAAGDTRATDAVKGGDGTWTYTRPGEHIFVTLTVDQNQVMSATASIGNWNDATASAEAGKPGTDDARVYGIKENGTGDNGQPLYEIFDAEGLQLFANIVNGVNCNGQTIQSTDGSSFTMPRGSNLSANAKLTADIDLGGNCHKVDGTATNDISWTPIGNWNMSNSKFAGSFDGQGHTVKNLYINSTDDFQGLFGYTEGSTIKDLTVENANVNTTGYYAGAIIGDMEAGTVTECTVTGNTQVNGTGYVGAIIGGINNGTVSNCHVTGTATATATNHSAGGIIGWMLNGTLTNCSSTASVKGTGEKSNSIGGIVGLWGGSSSYSGSTITGCVSTGAVSGKNHVGGLVGSVISANYKMTACYATGAVSGTGYYIGGLLGICWDNVNIEGCYYSGELGDGGSYRGALVGWNTSTGLVLNNCAAFSSVGDIGSTGSGIGSGNAAEGSGNNLTGAGTYSAIYGIVNATKQADGSSYWKTATTTGLKLYWEE